MRSMLLELFGRATLTAVYAEETYAMTRLEKLDDIISSYHSQADVFEKKLQTLQTLPPLPAVASGPEAGKAKSSGEAEPVEASEVVIEDGEL